MGNKPPVGNKRKCDELEEEETRVTGVDEEGNKLNFPLRKERKINEESESEIIEPTEEDKIEIQPRKVRKIRLPKVNPIITRFFNNNVMVRGNQAGDGVQDREIALRVVLEISQVDARILVLVSKAWLWVALPFVESRYAFNVNNAMYCSNIFCKELTVFDFNISLVEQAIINYWNHKAKITSFNFVVRSVRYAALPRNFEVLGEALPWTLEIKLQFECSLRNRLQLTFPNNITKIHVKVSNMCNIIFCNLPAQLEVLTFFGHMHSLVLPPVLPPSLHTLHLPYMDVAPPESITFPTSLQNLQIGTLPSDMMIRTLPKQEDIFQLGPMLHERLARQREKKASLIPKEQIVLPPNLLTFSAILPPLERIDWPLFKFPTTLTNLTLRGGLDIVLNNLPSTLRTLYICPTRPFFLGNLPEGLRDLTVMWQQPGEMCLPMSLTKLAVGSEAPLSAIFSLCLPFQLRVLDMWHVRTEKFHPLFFSNLPACLEEFILPFEFNSTLGRLPRSLRKLQLGPKFNNEINGKELPRNLRQLIFDGHLYTHGKPLDYFEVLRAHAYDDHRLLYLSHFYLARGGMHKIIYNQITEGKKASKLSEPILFNQPLNDLPNSIEEICFVGTSLFNQKFTRLPSRLKVLQFNMFKKQDLDQKIIASNRYQNYYPVQNKHTSKFNYLLDPVIPLTLRLLVLGKAYHFPKRFRGSTKVFVTGPRPPPNLKDQKFRRKRDKKIKKLMKTREEEKKKKREVKNKKWQEEMGVWLNEHNAKNALRVAIENANEEMGPDEEEEDKEDEAEDEEEEDNADLDGNEDMYALADGANEHRNAADSATGTTRTQTTQTKTTQTQTQTSTNTYLAN